MQKPGEGPPPRTRPSKVSKSSSEDIEIEIAEVLFGLKKQSQSNKRQENNGNELEPRDTKGSAHDSRSRASRSSPQSDPKFSVGEFTAQLLEQKLSKIIYLFLFNYLFILQVRLRKVQLQQKQRKLKANNNRKKWTLVLQEQVLMSHWNHSRRQH